MGPAGWGPSTDGGSEFSHRLGEASLQAVYRSVRVRKEGSRYRPCLFHPHLHSQRSSTHRDRTEGWMKRTCETSGWSFQSWWGGRGQEIERGRERERKRKGGGEEEGEERGGEGKGEGMGRRRTRGWGSGGCSG